MNHDKTFPIIDRARSHPDTRATAQSAGLPTRKLNYVGVAESRYDLLPL